MRTSTLSRSVIAVATLGIASVALAAAPATAATPSGISREMVLSAASYVRGGVPDEAQFENVLKLGDLACGVKAGEDLTLHGGDSVAAPANADGIVLNGTVVSTDGEGNETYRDCTFGAVATIDPAFTLSGTASLNVTTESFEATAVTATPLSGDVVVTAPAVVPAGSQVAAFSLTASGSATRSTKVTTSTKVAVKVSKAKKKAAKKTYASRLKSAKKSFTKALDKAGSSKSKKAAAKKSYARKKASAKAKYRAAVATSRIVTRTTTQVENRPFTISADYDYR